VNNYGRKSRDAAIVTADNAVVAAAANGCNSFETLKDKIRFAGI